MWLHLVLVQGDPLTGHSRDGLGLRGCDTQEESLVTWAAGVQFCTTRLVLKCFMHNHFSLPNLKERGTMCLFILCAFFTVLSMRSFPSG